jgi:divalent metal cation (Fe/Co/Zn/Cd) transporter
VNDCIEKGLVGIIGFVSSWNLQWVNPLLSLIISVLTIVYLVIGIKQRLGK